MKTCANLKAFGNAGVLKRDSRCRPAVGWLGAVTMLLLGWWWAPVAHGGIRSIGPIDSLTATGDAGLVTSINGIPVSRLLLGETSYANTQKYAEYPASNADNFDLALLGCADDQPFFQVQFPQAVVTIFFIENGGNDEGSMQALDAAGDPVGDIVPFDPSSFLVTDYWTSYPQVVAGLVVQMSAPVFGIRVLSPATTPMGFDPVSVSALVPAPAPSPLRWQRDPSGGGWEMVWLDPDLVLQYKPSVGAAWTDVPGATSPQPVSPEGERRFFRLRKPDAP